MSADKRKIKYELLLKIIMEEIDRIDSETPYQRTEPEWWLDMTEIYDIVKGKLIRLQVEVEK